MILKLQKHVIPIRREVAVHRKTFLCSRCAMLKGKQLLIKERG